MKRNVNNISLPPNLAVPHIVSPLATVHDVNASLDRLSLTASDLSPIDWRGKISAVRNQQNCGNCWAMSSTSCLTDRFIIKKGLDKSLDLNPVLTTQCVQQTQNQGCGGGVPLYAGQYFEQVGTVENSNSCPGFTKLWNGSLPVCSTLFSNCNNEPYLYKAVPGSSKTLAVSDSNGNVDQTQTIINMKTELLHGPIVGTFQVFNDFVARKGDEFYKWDITNGIYIAGSYDDDLNKKGYTAKGSWTDAEGWHAVEIVGWNIGQVNGKDIPYWIIKNSWGDLWNDNGYVYIAMNIPETGNLNKLLGLDIPLNIGNNSYAGGGTTFDPDITTGRPSTSGPVSPPVNNTQQSRSEESNKKTNIILIIVFGIILLSILMYLILFK